MLDSETRMIRDKAEGTTERYRIGIHSNAWGGMAMVYYGQDLITGRAIAVKFMGYGNNRENFTKEAQVLAQLNHPHIVRVFDLLEEDQTSFGINETRIAFVMEHIDAPTLTDVLFKQKRFSLKDTATVCEQIGSAIDYSFAQGHSHKDIKPSNILWDEKANHATLIDWGLVGVENLRLGTVPYVSPERILEKPVGLPSEVFSLGTSAFELITGSVPFGLSHNDSDTDQLETQVAIATGDYKRELLYAFPDDIREKLELVFDKVFAKDPAKRYQTAMEFAAAFRAAIS